jgi:hypothetical protein
MGAGTDSAPPPGPRDDQGLASTESQESPLAAFSVVRRLSRAEIDRTLRDLIGDDSAPATRLLPEDLYVPYDNDYSTQAEAEALCRCCICVTYR